LQKAVGFERDAFGHLLYVERDDAGWQAAISVEDVTELSADVSRLRIGFGKHLGRRLVDVESAYLRFCLDRFDDMPPSAHECFSRCVR